MKHDVKIPLLENSSDDLLTIASELKKGGYRFASGDVDNKNDIHEIMEQELRGAIGGTGVSASAPEGMTGMEFQEERTSETKQYSIPTGISSHNIGEPEVGKNTKQKGNTANSPDDLYRGISENSLDSIVLTDEQGRIVSFNAAMEKASGILGSEAIGRYLWDIQYQMAQPQNQTIGFYNALKSMALHWCKSGIRENEQTLFESEFINPEGRKLTFQSRIFAVKTVKGYCLGSISRDISDVKTLQNQLAENQKMYKAFLDATSDLAFLKDRDHRYVMVNRSFLSHFNVSEDDVIGKTDREFLAPEIFKNVRKTDESVVISGGLVIDEMRVGDQIHERRKFPVHFMDGSTGIGGFVRDVTELNHALNQETRLMGGLKELSDTAMDFISMGHSENLRLYIAGKLREIVRASAVIVTSYNPSTKKMHVESVSGLSQVLLKKIIRSEGGHLQNVSARVSPQTFKMLMESKLINTRHSLPQLISRYVGTDTIAALQQLTPGKVYVAGLVHNGELFGSALIVNPEKNFNLIVAETFCKQSSIALHNRGMLNVVQQNELRFRNMFEKNKDIIFTIDEQWQITSINPIGRKLITGKNGDKANIRQFMTSDSYKRIRKVLQKCTAAEESFCVEEVSMFTRNGSLLTFHISLLLTYRNHRIAEVFGIARNVTQNKMLQNEVLSKIIETEEREKRAFAEELHDGLGSLLSTINIYAGLLMKPNRSPKIRGEYLEQLRLLVHEAVNNVRQFANSLTPNVLNDFGMVAAIRIFCDRINNMHPGLVTFTESGNLKRFDRIVEINIYRITIEMINNTIKYCGAHSIDMSLSSTARNLKMEFVCKGEINSIDAMGQPTQANAWIRNIGARVNSLNGACDFRNCDPDNFLFIMNVPLAKRRTGNENQQKSADSAKTKK